MEVDSSDNYFTSYEDLEIHELMLKDTPRNNAFKNAIMDNREMFVGKTVIDVGSGTGILSIFAAQAGASKVYAVEASKLSVLSKEIIKENGFEEVIEVVGCRIEEFRLPQGVQNVDIIISEWMGFYLLHEGMLDSVLHARDRFLKPGGLLFPDKALIYLSPCSLPSYFDYWENVSGVKMTTFSKHLHHKKSNKPEILTIDKNQLLADDTVIAFLDLNDIGPSDLEAIEFSEVIVARKPGKFQGFAIWFDVMFPSKDENDSVTLSTHPQSEPTHWKQTIVPLPSNDETLEPLDPVAFKLVIQRNQENQRHYNLILEMLEPSSEDVQHPLPCDCHLTKCILSKAHLASIANQNDFEIA